VSLILAATRRNGLINVLDGDLLISVVQNRITAFVRLLWVDALVDIGEATAVFMHWVLIVAGDARRVQFDGARDHLCI